MKLAQARAQVPTQGLRQVTNMRLMPDMALRLGIAAVATSFFGDPNGSGFTAARDADLR